MKTILFQGDSITDCGRDRENISSFGTGYANLLISHLSAKHPCELNFYNKGISGNRIVDIYARAKCDIWHLKPDFISLLIGVNDVWHEFAEVPNGVELDRFKDMYKMLIEHTQQKVKGVKFLLMEPFCLPGTATILRGYDKFSHEVLLRANAVKEIAEEYKLPFLKLQYVLNSACDKAPAEYWLHDGVHPSSAGHALIANCWEKEFSDILDL